MADLETPSTLDRIARVISDFMEGYARSKGYQIEPDGYFRDLPVHLFDQAALAMEIEDQLGAEIPESFFHNCTFRQIAAAFDAKMGN